MEGYSVSSDGYLDLYGASYHERYHERTDEWLRFFATTAERIVSGIGPRSVLDAGCAKGLLVEALRDREVAAYGIDASAYAIAQVRDDIKPYCWVGSVADPLLQRYDLIVCTEVLEHLPPEDGRRAIANLCRSSDDILISTTPDDYRDPTHLNVRPPEYWATAFAECGFWRDVNYDAAFIAPWAMRFRKGRDPVSRQLAAYERKIWLLTKEVLALRSLAQDQERDIHALRTQMRERSSQGIAPDS